MQEGGVPPEHWKVAALYVDNAFKPLINMEMYVKGQQINLKCRLIKLTKIFVYKDPFKLNKIFKEPLNDLLCLAKKS